MDQNHLKMPEKADISQTKEKILYGTSCFWELSKWIIVLVILFTMAHFFVATLFIVDGVSMEPNYHSGEYIIVNRWQYLFGKPERGDTVVLKFPGDPENKKYIKRIIGLPGENVIVQEGSVFINGQKLDEKYLPSDTQTLPNVNRTLREDDFFLLGDNRANSSDSRVWGVANRQHLIGSAWVVLYPFETFGIVPKALY
ncbi:MAG: signal peptidase I [Candidatus Berkelbacteria bacterium]|nr:signal peptidase I [Candidatus Berkelbacteria bacterium]